MERKISICIPSYNRGELASHLVYSLLERIEKKKYIEVVMSNNGSIDGVEYYTKIKEIKNGQLVYHEFEKNEGFEKNLRKAISLAHSNLCMILSDEDDVIIDNVRYYVDYFDKNPKLAVMYSKIAKHPTFSMHEEVYWKAGYDAARSFYGDAYISGIIINKKIFGDKQIEDIYSDYGHYYTYKFIPHLYWLGEAVLKGDFAYNPMVDLIKVGKNISSRDLDCKKIGQLSISRVMLPESYISNSHEIIKFIMNRNATIDVKALMFQQYLRYAYMSISLLELADKANCEYSLDRVDILSKIYESLDKNLETYVSDCIEKRILRDIAGYEYGYSIEKYSREAYLDSMIFMPEDDEIESYIQHNDIRVIGIYGVGKAAEMIAVLIYRKIRNITSVVLIDRDPGRFTIDASNPGKMQRTDPDFYKMDIFAPDSLPNDIDLIIVACSGVITEVRKNLIEHTNAKVVSIMELYKIIKGTSK